MTPTAATKKPTLTEKPTERRPHRVKPFKSNLEYLSELMGYLTALARVRVLARREATPTTRPENGKGRRLKEDRLHALMHSAMGAAIDAGLRHKRIMAQIQKTLAGGKVSLPLEQLARENGLSEFEKLILALVLTPNVNTAIEQYLMDLSHSRYTTVRLALDILCETLPEKIRARKFFVQSGSLLGKGLLNMSFSQKVDTESEFMEMELQLPRRVSSFILGEFDVDDQLVTFSSVIDPEVDISQVVLPPGKIEEVLQLLAQRDEYLRLRHDWGFDRILSYGKGTILLFHGASGTGKTMLAHALAKSTGHRLMLVDFRKILHLSRNDFEENLKRVFHEAHLQHAIILFDEADEMFSAREENGAMPTLLREFEKLDGIAILATNRRRILDEALERRILYKLEFTLPTPEMREAIWRKHLPSEAPLSDDINPKALADEFEFAGGHIKNAVLLAFHMAMQREGDTRRITQADLRAGAILQRRNRLEGLIGKVLPRVALKDVILPPETKQQVEAIVAAARNRELVYTKWGFAEKMNTGKSLSCLFVGESGTGKTMTAEAIAFELGQALYPVNLAGVVSKWVGETEKNIAAVFASARESQAILFIDEADSLFGSRLDEESHHAHYINGQVNLLLTEMDKFNGIVILATNRARAFDQAFERRIRYRVEFAKPDVKAREAIWRGLIPKGAPVAPNLDFAALAQRYDFSGGTIKNVVMRAAFEAATNGQVITQAALAKCAKDELPLEGHGGIGFASRR